MLHWKEFSAWVTIDGEEVAEYNVETSEDAKTVTCWIASELGKKFSVCWKKSYWPQDVTGYTKVDGIGCGGKVLQGLNPTYTVNHNGATDGRIVKPFMFSWLELTDDDALLGSSSHPELGLIELTITPIKVIERNVVLTLASIAPAKVHERSKKAVTQQITLAEPELLPMPQSSVRTQRTGPDLVTFSFKYRPIDILRANGIAPSSLKRKASAEPEPPRAQTPGDSEDLADMQEAQVLREKLKALEAKLQKREKKPKIKSDAGAVIDLTQESSRSNKRVKLEGKRSFISGEIIDLT
ncbi:hypothetical protein B0H19DRAFT_1095537 [Mycena capillaripes]|nr:hypothetical protein B0H19DRAFT_1095537 [Mycena capillaripes]